MASASAQRGGHVLALDRPHRMDDDELVGREPDAGPLGGAVAGSGVHVEAVADGDGIDAAIAELVAGQVVDGDVAPRRVVVGQLVEAGVAVALPGRVVVVPEGREPGPGAGHGPRRR